MTKIAIQVVKRIGKYKVRDWRENHDAKNMMCGEIDDIIFEVAEEFGLEIPVEQHDVIIDKCIEIAIANED